MTLQQAGESLEHFGSARCPSRWWGSQGADAGQIAHRDGFGLARVRISARDASLMPGMPTDDGPEEQMACHERARRGMQTQGDATL